MPRIDCNRPWILFGQKLLDVYQRVSVKYVSTDNTNQPKICKPQKSLPLEDVVLFKKDDQMLIIAPAFLWITSISIFCLTDNKN